MTTQDTNTPPPIADRALWDSMGNSCRITLYPYGDRFELYIHEFNDSIPLRYVGGLGELNARADMFLDRQKAAGFVEQLPSYNPTWRA